MDGALRALWAKTSDTPGDDGASATHPLACHLLDAAAVAEALWHHALSPATRRLIARATGGDLDAAARAVVTLAAVHDLGKATPAFARRHAPCHTALARVGLPFPEFGTEGDHARLGGYLVKVHRAAVVRGGVADLAARAAEIVAGHHGTFRPAADLGGDPVREASGLRPPGDAPWRTLQGHLLHVVSSALQAGGAGWGIDALDPGDRPARATITGLVIAADWLASSEADFPYATDPVLPDFDAYLRGARVRAQRALDRHAWRDLPAPVPPLPFDRLFGLPGGPNALQEATRLRAPDGPALVVVEAPMGLGKTEAALDLFDRAARATGQTGLFVGLPTQATANGIFDRLATFLRHRHGGATANVQLLHGHAQLAAAFMPLVTADATAMLAPRGIHDPADGPDEGAVVAAAWFQGRRRGLLAQFGAGTVDQAMLAALRTRFLPLRLLGLAGKVVVVDEVHAYDVYMSTIIARLLEWLAALDCTVILLSATLPRARRDELAEAYRAGLARRVPVEASAPEASTVTAPYPRITWAGRDGVRIDHVALPTAPRDVRLIRRPEAFADPGAFGAWLADALAGGGCAVVIATTVRRAQDLYRALAPWFPGDADDGDPVLGLFHARFPFAWRETIELRVRRRFGAPGRTVPGDAGPVPVRRPHRAVLVATQVVEQSLDLDFDLLVTEAAPGDLLLQRMGRVHRHPRDQRPPGLEGPVVCLLVPDAREDGTPGYARDQMAIYAEAPLLRTALALRGRDTIRLPDDIDPLVEATYANGVPDGTPEAWGTRLRDADAAHARARDADATQAMARLVPSPWTGEALTDLTSHPTAGALIEDAPDVNAYLRAQTRLGDDTVALVCLLDDGDGLRACGDPPAVRLPTDVLAVRPVGEVERRLLRAVVAVADWRAVRDLRASPCPTGWTRHPLLRDARAATFTPDPAGQPGAWHATAAGHLLRLDARTGLTVVRDDAATTPSEGVPPP